MLTAEYASALEALERGWSVIPINPDNKRPLVKWEEYQERYPTDEELQEWWTEWPLAMPAVITGWRSGVYIVDCDTSEAIEAAEALGISSPVRVRTKKGVHHYFAHPHDGKRRGPRVGAVGSADAAFAWPKVKGLDWRGDGGYALIATEGSKYSWDIAPGFTLEDMPAWDASYDARLSPATAPVETPSDDPLELDLTHARVLDPDSHLSMWEKTEKHARTFPGQRIPTGQGNGRNRRVMLHLAEAIRMGVWGDNLEKTGREFMAAFYAEPLGEREFLATLRWICQAERRSHPENFDAAGNYAPTRVQPVFAPLNPSLAPAVSATPTPQNPPQAQPQKVMRPFGTPFIRMRDLPALNARISARKDLIGPFIPAGGCIIQVYGYSGHGKSTFVQHLLGGACAARPGKTWWGPFEIKKVPRVLYLNFEEGEATIRNRLEELQSLYGDTGDNLTMWYPGTTLDLVASMRDDNFLREMGEWVRDLRPDIVVIDTARTAWPGLEETKAEAWAPINTLALKLRNVGIAVLILHHGNKPSEQHSVGTEAGSTAQLNNIETQIRIVRIYKDEAEARINHGLFNGKLNAEDFGYIAGTDVFDTLARDAGADFIIEYALEARYRKLREPTDEHDRAYVIGFARHLITGERRMVSSYSVKQRAMYFHGQGVPLTEIARRTLRPVSVLRQWLQLP